MKNKLYKFTSIILALVMTVVSYPTSSFSDVYAATVISKIVLGYDDDYVELNTNYTEGVVEERLETGCTSTTTGGTLVLDMMELLYLDNTANTYTGVIKDSDKVSVDRKYCVRYRMTADEGYSWPEEVVADEDFHTVDTFATIEVSVNTTKRTDAILRYDAKNKYLEVYIPLSKATSTAVISSVTIGEGDMELNPGDEQEFTVTVEGNAADKTVTWSLEGAANKDTTLDEDGYLTISEDETSKNLSVKAASNFNNKRFDIVNITLNVEDDEDNPDDSDDPDEKEEGEDDPDEEGDEEKDEEKDVEDNDVLDNKDVDNKNIKNVEGVGTISADGRTITDTDGTKYQVSTKVENKNLKKGTMIADKKSTGKYKITSTTKKKGKVTTGTVTYTKPYNQNVKTVKINPTVKIAGATFKVTTIEKNTFKNCKKLKSVNINKNIEIIGEGAFSGCVNLTKVVIPANVKKIGKKAFFGCKKLKTIKIKTRKLKKKSIGKKAFKGISKKATFKVPKKKLKAYKKLIKKAGAPNKVKIK